MSGWPVTLESAGVRLRPLEMRDAAIWCEVRLRNAEWLRRWDATAPTEFGHRAMTFRAMIRVMRKAARVGTQIPFAIEVEGTFVGQVTVNNIVRGSAQFASIGYWIDEGVANRGIVTRAVAMVVDYCFSVAELHRLEIAIRPENAASLRVVDKLGFGYVGLAQRYLHIDGEWRDHMLFSLIKEDVPEGMMNRLYSQESQK